MSDDPWSKLATPDSPDAISARRVDADGRWNFFWARDSENRLLLVLRYNPDAAPHARLPRLRGIEVFVYTDEVGGFPSLALRLREGALRDLFYRLCIDIIASTGDARTEREAVAIALARTWRWHHLLRGGGDTLLSSEEQKGLIGELLVLESYFLPVMSPSAALTAWRGPLGEAKDFLVGRVAVESKAHGDGAAASVRISSEFQLDDSGLDRLFLHVSVLDPAGADDEDDFTISDVAERIRSRLLAIDTHFSDQYDALLMAAGFRKEDDYSRIRWKGGKRGIYWVHDSFPRLIPSGVPAGISSVTYNLEIAPCGSSLVDPAALLTAVAGALGAH